MNVSKLLIVMVGVLTLVGPAWANVGDQVVDGVIPAGTATIDGDLSEWSGAIWNKADQPYTDIPPNVLDPDWDPEWTARWNGSSLFVAVRVVDNTPFHTDTYVAFPASDRIELYSRGSGTAGAGIYGTNADGYEPAQHYFVGITDSSLDSGGGSSWGTLGPTDFPPATFPENRVLNNNGTDALTVATSATGTVDGTHTLIYEIEMKQYNSFDATSAATSGTGQRTLAVGDTVGFAVAVGSRFEAFVSSGVGYAGTVSAGGQGGMFNNFNLFGLYELTAAPGDFDEDGDVDGFDFLAWQRGESPNNGSADDLAEWEGNFGAPGPLAALAAGVGAVPEPSTFFLLLVGLGSSSLLQRRRRLRGNAA